MLVPFIPDESKNSMASASIPVAGLNISRESNTGIIPQLEANRFLAGDASKEVNIPTLIPDNNESLILPNTSLTLQKTDLSRADVSITVTNPSVDSLTSQAMQKLDNGLKTLATDPDFTQKDVSTIVTDSSVDSLTGQAIPRVAKKIKKLTAAPDFTEKMDKKDKTSAATNGERHLLQADLGPFAVQGSIGYFYDKNPNIAKDLGQPTGREYQFPPGGKWRQNFQNGAIFHSANGTFSVHGSLGNYYLNVLRGQDSQLGLPTSEESYTGNGNWRQNFEKGTLEWLNNGTAKVTLNSGNNSQLPTSIQLADPFFKLQYLNAKYNPNGPNGSNNCGPASLAMILKMLGKEPANISVETSIDYARAQMFGYSNSVKQGLNVLDLDRQSTNWDQIKAGITKTGGKPEDLQGWAQLDQSLNQGKPVISWGFLRPEWRQQFPQRVGDGYTPHLNAILGKTPDGKYIVADPMHQGGPVAMTKQQLSVFYWQPDRGSYQPVFIAFGKK